MHLIPFVMMTGTSDIELKFSSDKTTCELHFNNQSSRKLLEVVIMFFNKWLTVEINWNPLAKIIGYLYDFGTGVPKK